MPILPVVGSYAGVEAMKRRCAIVGTDRDAQVLDHLNAASRAFERDSLRRFFPVTAVNLYRWPPYQIQPSWSIWVDDDLLAVTSLQTAVTGAGASPVTLAHFYLEPQQFGPPYSRIEVDLSTQDVFQSGPTPQRSLSIAGRWGYCENTIAAGTLQDGSGINASVTTLLCSDASLIDQGDVLLIDSEAIYVSGRAQADTGATLAQNIDTQKGTVIVPVSDGTKVNAGELIQIDAETMYVASVVGNNVNLLAQGRGYDGSVTASHLTGAHVYAPRTLSIVRGVNGTTAATHANAAPIVKYQAPADVRRQVIGDAVAAYAQEEAQYGRTVGAGDMAVEFTGKKLEDMRLEVLERYERVRVAAI